MRTRLPVSDSLLIRKNLTEKEIQEKIRTKREVQKYYYDRNAKSLPVLDIGDSVIFKKSGNEWNYGMIVGNVNNRSYVIRDSFRNCFRRNRRFIAKTRNRGFVASDLLFEENIGSGGANITDQMKEIVIVPPTCQGQVAPEGDNDVNNDCEVDEPELPVVVEADEASSSDNYETAGDNDSETDSDGAGAPQMMPANVPYRTRYGRNVRPPQRYGW